MRSFFPFVQSEGGAPAAPRRRLAALLTLSCVGVLGVGCKQSGGAHVHPGADDDAGVEAGVDGPTIQIPGSRPQLTDPGQIVPLLYGRSALVEDRRGGSVSEIRIPLDDPSYESHQAFFSDLERVCRARVTQLLSTSAVNAECGPGAVYQGLVGLCRADAALAFAAERPAASLAGEGAEMTLTTDTIAGDARWVVSSRALQDRASWALYAVGEQRKALAALAFALDPTSCTDDLSEPARSESDTVFTLAARGLRDAYQALPETTGSRINC